MLGIIEDFRGGDGLWKTTKTRMGVCYPTRSGGRWYGMVGRCKAGGSAQKKDHSYIGCSNLFADFQEFVEWHRVQVGYMEDGYHLDKDILIQGNKVYSKSTCVLVPHQLNTFFVSRRSLRGVYPQGVYLYKATGKFVASVRSGSERKHIGSYDSADKACAAYKVAKEAEAQRWYKRLEDGEFVVDKRVIERMRTWTLEES